MGKMYSALAAYFKTDEGLDTMQKLLTCYRTHGVVINTTC